MARMRHLPTADLEPEGEGEGSVPVIQPEIARVLLNQRVIRELNREMPGFNRAGLLAEIFAYWGMKKGYDAVLVDEDVLVVHRLMSSNIVPRITSLLRPCRPSDIPRFIIPVVVNPVQRMFRRRRSAYRR